jgi:tRNA 2-thiouridine synthesizing protein A
MMTIETPHSLDATGLYCPEPVMMLHNAVRDLTSGDILKVLATDPSTERDIPKFCLFLGHTLMAQEQSGDQYLYFIQIA